MKGRRHGESVWCHQPEMMGEPGAMGASCWGWRARRPKGTPLGSESLESSFGLMHFNVLKNHFIVEVLRQFGKWGVGANHTLL